MFEFNPNFIEILAATVAAMVTGMLWFGPLFSKVWMKETGMSMKDIDKDSMPMTYGFAFLSALVTATLFSTFVNTLGLVTLDSILKLSFLAWLGFTAPAMLNKVLWGKDSVKLYTIESLYQLTVLLVIGIVVFLV